jgi:hypothetical protein
LFLRNPHTRSAKKNHRNNIKSCHQQKRKERGEWKKERGEWNIYDKKTHHDIWHASLEPILPVLCIGSLF